jgi:hypothetical protein
MRALLADTLRIFTRNDGRMLSWATVAFARVSVTPMFLIAPVRAGAERSYPAGDYGTLPSAQRSSGAWPANIV